MAYLLKNMEGEDDPRRRQQRGDGDGDGGAPTLLRSFFTALHSVPPAAHRPPPLSQPFPARPPTGVAGTGAGANSHTQGSATGSAGVSDEELYRRAMDFADVVSIVNAPTQPPTRHGFAVFTPFARSDGGDSVTAAAGVGPWTAGGNLADGDRAGRLPTHGQQTLDGTPLFKRIAEDAETGVEVYSAAVKDSPIHLMRAVSIMPCSPGKLLQYMDNDIRPQWDAYVRESHVIRELPSPDLSSHGRNEGVGMSQCLRVKDLGNAKRRETSLAAESTRPDGPQAPGTGAKRGTTAAPEEAPAPAPSQPSLPGGGKPFAFLPGQHRVALHYLGVKSPVMFVQDRDFELVVSESVLPDGAVVMKAFSAPIGMGVPPDPAQARYVRAVVVLSGIVGRPLSIPTSRERRLEAEAVVKAFPPLLRRVATDQLRACDSRRELRRRKPSSGTTAQTMWAAVGAEEEEGGDQEEALQYCLLEYFGLVHPLGLIPPYIANVVISAQTTTLRRLQTFVASHLSLDGLRPTPPPMPEWKRQKEEEKRLVAQQEKAEAKGTEDDGAAGTASQGDDGDPWWRHTMSKLRARL